MMTIQHDRRRRSIDAMSLAIQTPLSHLPRTGTVYWTYNDKHLILTARAKKKKLATHPLERLIETHIRWARQKAPRRWLFRRGRLDSS